MKKLVLFAFAAFGLSIAKVDAQSNVTFKVDADDFINNGGVMVNGVVSIAGAFTDRGGNLSNWTPSAGAMNDLGNNLWEKTIAFSGPNIASDSLEFKYVQGSDWPDGDEGNDWVDPNPPCTIGGFKNRWLVVPTTGDWIFSSKWAECGTIATATSKFELVSGLAVEMGPNPTSSSLNVRFGGSANSVIKMSSVDGRIVKTVKVSTSGDSQNTIDVSDLNAGVYYVTVVDGKKGFQAPVVIVK